jgi:phospholipase/lecithinase/hemolysin
MIARFFCSCIALVVLGFPPAAVSALFTNVHVIGDSLSDQGNLFAATASLGGPALPASDHYSSGRFSNGPAYTDYLAQRLQIPLQPSFQNGTNFAYGGARTTYNVVEQSVPGGIFPDAAFPWTLNSEVQAFRARGIHDPGALYIVWSGSNDIADLTRSGGANSGAVIGGLVTGILDAIDAFQDAGARRILVPNVPDLGLTPAFFLNPNPNAAPAATFFSAQFNNALHAALASVTDVEIIELDTFSWLRDLVSNPGAFGLTNVTFPCYNGFVAPNPSGVECPNPDEFLFWDLVHPTTVVHSILADFALAAVLPLPSTLALLLLALLVLARVAAPRPMARS